MSNKLRDCIARLESIIYGLEERIGINANEDVALLISSGEVVEIINMLSANMSAWEARHLRDTHTNLKYKNYRLMVI